MRRALSAAGLFACGFLAATSLSYAEERSHLFILSGQSNMARLKSKESFTPAVEEAFGKENVTVVRNAHRGKPISKWYKNYTYPEGRKKREGETFGEHYDDLMKVVKTAVEGKTFDTVTFVWMQGESDAKSKLDAVYAESFKGILAQLKEDLKRDEINFVIGRLSDFKGYDHQSWDGIRDAQVKLAEDAPNGEWVDTDDLNDKKNDDGSVKHDLHYTPEGYKLLGQRFAEKAIVLIKKEGE